MIIKENEVVYNANEKQIGVSDYSILSKIIGKQADKFDSISINEIAKMSFGQLEKIVGKNAADKLVACCEFSRRTKQYTNKISLNNSSDIYETIKDLLCDLNHEEFWIILLNTANKEICRCKMSSGGINQTIVDHRLILKYAIENLATKIVCIHNHPSGNTTPSSEDIHITKKLFFCCNMFNIVLVDHIIIGKGDYLSMFEAGYLN